jgi:addiction module HigA family antidote
MIPQSSATSAVVPIHPGEVLIEEFLDPLGLSQNRLAMALGVPARRINEIVLGKRSITADTALRLAAYFGSSAEYWLELQMAYDLETLRLKKGERIEGEVKRPAVMR